jgi:hypothetical protein
MSTFERDEFKWRETYFVLFDSCNRPALKKMEQVLQGLGERFQLSNGTADEDGRFESLTVMSPDDYAALDISYESGEEVTETVNALEEDLKETAADADEKAKLARIGKFDARIDLLHFEQTSPDEPEDDLDEMLDPSLLLIVLDAVVELTDGVGIDPQSGAIL